MISAIFRRGGDVTFVVEELKAVFDPQGGQWMGGRYVPSLLAAIGGVIETPHDPHRLPGRRAGRARRIAETASAGRRRRRAGRRRAAVRPRPRLPALQLALPAPPGRLPGVRQLRLFQVQLSAGCGSGLRAQRGQLRRDVTAVQCLEITHRPATFRLEIDRTKTVSLSHSRRALADRPWLRRILSLARLRPGAPVPAPVELGAAAGRAGAAALLARRLRPALRAQRLQPDRMPAAAAGHLLLVRRDAGRHAARCCTSAAASSDAPTLNLARIRQRGAQLGANEVHVHFLAETDGAAPARSPATCAPASSAS